MNPFCYCEGCEEEREEEFFQEMRAEDLKLGFGGDSDC